MKEWLLFGGLFGLMLLGFTIKLLPGLILCVATYFATKYFMKNSIHH